MARSVDCSALFARVAAQATAVLRVLNEGHDAADLLNWGTHWFGATCVRRRRRAVEDAAVPTHRDYPWEHDRRAVQERLSRGSTTSTGGAYRPPVAVRSRPAVRAPTWGAPTWRGPIAFAVFAVVAIVFMARLGSPDAAPPVSLPAPPAALLSRGSSAVVSGSITGMRTRFVGRTRLEVWGKTSAPDGSSISLRLKASDGSPITLPDAPAVAGRFYARAAIPPRLQGRAVTVSARAIP